MDTGLIKYYPDVYQELKNCPELIELHKREAVYILQMAKYTSHPMALPLFNLSDEDAILTILDNLLEGDLMAYKVRQDHLGKRIANDWVNRYMHYAKELCMAKEPPKGAKANEIHSRDT